MQLVENKLKHFFCFIFNKYRNLVELSIFGTQDGLLQIMIIKSIRRFMVLQIKRKSGTNFNNIWV